MQYLPPWAKWIESKSGFSAATQRQILISILGIVLLWAVRRWILHYAIPRIKDARARYRFRKVSAYVAYVLGVLLLGQLWLSAFSDVTTFLGLLSAGIAIALRDALVNLVGWGYILWRKPFVVGDRIQIGQHAGDVIDLSLFAFTILEIGNWVDADQSTGRVIHVPNGRVFIEPVADYERAFPFLWNELTVRLSFESDWEKAKGILLQIANHHTEQPSEDVLEKIRDAGEKFMLHLADLSPAVFTSKDESGVVLTVRYLCQPRRRRETTQAIWEDTLRAFAREPEIAFGYPTQRFFRAPEEGKAGGGAMSSSSTRSTPD